MDVLTIIKRMEDSCKRLQEDLANYDSANLVSARRTSLQLQEDMKEFRKATKVSPAQAKGQAKIEFQDFDLSKIPTAK